MHKNKTYSRTTTLTLVCSSALVIANSAALASGFGIPELNTTGLGTSNALVANPKVLGAIAYNPAAMSFHQGKSLSLGTLLVKPDLTADTGSGSVDSKANDVVIIPAITAHNNLNKDWTLGISVNAPFGLETEWQVETYNQQYPAGTGIPTKTKLEIAAFSPSVAYKLSDRASLAFGVDYYWMKEVTFNSKINTGTGVYPKSNLEGDGRSTGFNLGGMLVLDSLSFGASYHSSSKIKVEGTLDDGTGTLQSKRLSDNVTATLELPWRLQLGVRHQTTEKLAIEFDFTRTGWKTFDSLNIKNKEYRKTLSTSINNFDNANAYRLGVTYDFSQATQLRVGYTYDETPQKDERFSIRIPDADRQLFSLGIGHTLSNNWTLEAGYMYVKFDDRTIDSPTTAVAGQEANGTTAVNGTYISNVQLFGFGISKTFM